jgi:adhesin/invasin
VTSSSFAKVLARIVIGVSLLATAAFCQNTVSVVSGDGQVIRIQNATPASNLLTVIVRDSAGNPVPKATLTWAVSPTGQGQVTSPSTVTDANGKSTNSFIAPNLLGFVTTSFAQTKITATLGSSVATFVETVMGSDGNINYLTSQVIHPSGSQLPLNGVSGQQGAVPIQLRVFVVGGSSIGAGVPHVLMTVAQEAGSAATATCAEGSVFTDANGFATCHVLYGKVGSGALDVSTSLGTITFSFNVTQGPPGLITVVSGDNQTGRPGQPLAAPLRATVSDLGGNVLAGVSVSFQAVVANTVTFTNVQSTSDAQGRVSAVATPAATDAGGPVKVTVSTLDGKASATFTITVQLNLAPLTIAAGNNQSAKIGTAFATQLAVIVTDTSGNPIQNEAVTFAVTSGSATLGTPNPATTNALGQASITVTAGTTPGPVLVTATVGTLSTQFNLTVQPPGPSCIAGSTFFNGASFLPFISPGGVATIYCSGIAQGIQGVVMPSLFGGPLPYQIAGVSVTFGTANIPAPIYDVVNWNGSESVTVEVPVDETLVGPQIPVTITASDGSTTVNADVSQAAPGIFESIGSDNVHRAVVLRPDGSVATSANPILRGETGRTFVTGLIPPAGLGTDMLSPLDSDIAITTPVIVGVDNAGVKVVLVQYARNMVGVWEVQFVVPSSGAAGPRDAPFAVAVPVNGKLVFAQSSLIPVQ